jgi:hypothetical protein
MYTIKYLNMYKKDISYGEPKGYIMSCGSYMNNFV